MTTSILLATVFVSLAFLGWSWIKDLGIGRAGVAISCRLLWLSPLLLALFPEIVVTDVPNTFKKQTLHIFIDDSTSMQGAPRHQTQKMLHWLQKRCLAIGCVVRPRYLSQLSQETYENYSPLSLVLDSWFAEVGTDPWLLFTDGGDFQPELAWSAVLPDQGGNSKGMILGFTAEQEKNIWLEKIDSVPLAFENDKLFIHAHLKRSLTTDKERVQVQVINDDKVIASQNTVFTTEMSTAETSIAVPPLMKGIHLLEIKLLPVSGEKDFWDNRRFMLLEVLPDTVGVLHLLGSPGWDGSFMRRYLKSEPKYDLVSFFILRDPWDSANVDERELSLIPFPVDQLFAQELENFKVLIIQNFSLYRFLKPEHQRNLVDFVLQGGALLFIGGPRALRQGDIINSPLREILPFSKEGRKLTQQEDTYQADFAFELRFAAPSTAKRELASVFDDWLEMQEELLPFTTGQGLNRITVSGQEYTPLIMAKNAAGVELPLAVASYPGKGRAIWLFSDSFWRLAMSGISRHSYHKFFHRAMTWLLKQDLNKPLLIKNFTLRRDRKLRVIWQLELHGAATKYFSLSRNWQIELCGQMLNQSELKLETLGSHRKLLRGEIKPGDRDKCRVEITGSGKAFGSLQVASIAVLPVLHKDEEIGKSAVKLAELAAFLRVPLVTDTESFSNAIRKALTDWLGKDTIPTTTKKKTQKNHYWILSEPYYFLLLLFLPAEVLIRRWREIG